LRYKRMRQYSEQSNELATSLLSQSWADYTMNTCGYNFRKGQLIQRLIGTFRRECLDQMLIYGESHLRQILSDYAAYYNCTRTHLALQKNAPIQRAIQPAGNITAIPILGGLHHEYVRI
jgi:hypothetical protein